MLGRALQADAKALDKGPAGLEQLDQIAVIPRQYPAYAFRRKMGYHARPYCDVVNRRRNVPAVVQRCARPMHQQGPDFQALEADFFGSAGDRAMKTIRRDNQGLNENQERVMSGYPAIQRIARLNKYPVIVDAGMITIEVAAA